MEVLKIEQRTFEQLQVVDVFAVGEVKLVPQERVQQWFGCVEVVQCEQEPERITKRTVDSCRSVEVVKSIPQERSSERTCEQSEVINVTSSQDQIWQRSVEQFLVRRGMSRLHDWLGGFVNG